MEEKRHRIDRSAKDPGAFVFREGKAGFRLISLPPIFPPGLFQGAMAELLGRHFKSSKVT